MKIIIESVTICLICVIYIFLFPFISFSIYLTLWPKSKTNIKQSKTIMKKLFLTSILLLFSVNFLLADNDKSGITNDEFWYTVSGKPIYSQGGGIFRFTDPTTGKPHYYWYGVHYSGAENYQKSPLKKSDDSGFISVTCYQSDDLINWTFVKDVLTSSEVNSHEGAYWVGRLGVAYVSEAKKYAIVVQYNNNVLFATCDTPDGNYKWNNKLDMTSLIGTSNTGDQTVFTDDNGKSYLVYSYGKGRSKIYLSEIGLKDGKITLLDCHQIYQGSGREGNCMFKYKDRYYVCASDLYGWNASNVYYLVSNSIYGPYTPTNKMSLMDGAGDDYGHVTQTGFFYTVKGTNEETVIYCGDRWADFAGNGNGYNQWCPLSFNEDKPYFNSLSSWKINVKTGEWTVGNDNNYVKNGSFDADRVNIPSGNKPKQDYLRGWNTIVSTGNKVVIGSADSPVLNASNSSSDRMTVIGNHCLNITDKMDFIRQIYQTIKTTPGVPLKDGIYCMSAKVKCGKGFNLLEMYAKSGNRICHIDIPDNDGTWHDIVIDSITVAGGNVELGFHANGIANSWCHVDDVKLIYKHKLSDATSITSSLSAYTKFPIEYYLINGTKISSPRKGINIQVQKLDNHVTSRKYFYK